MRLCFVSFFFDLKKTGIFFLSLLEFPKIYFVTSRRSLTSCFFVHWGKLLRIVCAHLGEIFFFERQQSVFEGGYYLGRPSLRRVYYQAFKASGWVVGMKCSGNPTKFMELGDRKSLASVAGRLLCFFPRPRPSKGGEYNFCA